MYPRMDLTRGEKTIIKFTTKTHSLETIMPVEKIIIAATSRSDVHCLNKTRKHYVFQKRTNIIYISLRQISL